MILGIPVFFWSGETERAEKLDESLILVTEQYALRQHHGASLAMKGQVLVLKDEIEATVPVSWDAVERLRVAQFHVVGIGALRAFAEGLARCEQHADAISSIDEALALAGKAGGAFSLPELLRTKAEILLGLSQPDLVGAENLLFSFARQRTQSIRARLELQTGLSLARFCRRWAATERGDPY